MSGPHVHLITARFYDDITDDLVAGATQAVEAEGGTVSETVVPGILEIPAALSFLVQSGRAIDGFVVLGCAIKGETDHYDHVGRECIAGVQQIALQHNLAVGNGVLTCPTKALAQVRASVSDRNFGGQAGRACLRMIELKQSAGV